MIGSVSHFNPHARGKIDETSTYPMSFRFKRHTDIYYLEMLNVLCLFLKRLNYFEVAMHKQH